MTHRPRNMAVVYLVMVLLLGFIAPSMEQQQSTQPPPPKQQQQQHMPSQTELQAILFLHNLIQANPDINKLIQYAESLPANSSNPDILQGVTLNPLLSMAMLAMQNMQSPMRTPNSTSHTNTTSTQNATNPQPAGFDPASLFQQLMQNPVYAGILTEVSGEVMSGLQRADADHVNLASNMTALFHYIDVLSILRKALVPVLASSQFSNQPGLVNEACYRDVIDTLEELVNGQGWALKMFDALGKPNAGIMRGSLYFVGSYDQCVDIEPHVERKGPLVGTSRDFGTRHCRVDIEIPPVLTNAFNVDTHGVDLKFIWGMCVPSSCHKRDIGGLFKLGILNQTGINVKDVKCQEETDIGADKSAVAAIVIYSFFGLLVLSGTLIDGCRACAEDGEAKDKPTNVTKPRDTAPSQNGATNGGFILAESTNVTKPHDIAPPQNGATNGGFTLAAKKQTEAGVIGDVTATSISINTEEVNVDLPPGYVPHKEGLHLPMYSHKYSLEPQATANGGARNKQEIERSRDREPKRQDPVFIRVLLCFSVYTNIPKVLGAKSAPGSISCVHGIRLLSILWVILGHTYNYGIISNEGTFTADNMLDFEGVMQRFTFQGVMAAGYSVDTFFMLSAFLLTWIQLKEADKRKRKLDIHTGVLYYFHRFWRLTPIYMFVMMGYSCLFKYLGSGPFWPNDFERCRDSWWTNLLYVNNLVKTDPEFECMGWAWYLANDMQFYIISPIFIVAMYISAIPGAILTTLLLLMGVGLSFWKEHVYNGGFLTMLSDGGDYWKNVYTVPWCRVSPWAVGLLLGLIIYKRGKRPLRNKKLYALGWILAWGVALFLVYITHTKQKKDGIPWTRVESAFHESVGRAAWAACVGWVIFACYTGKGGIVNSILSWNGLIPLSRLSYAAYLVHPICMQVYMFSRRNLFHANDYNIIYLFLGHSCFAFMVAFVFSLAFEAPFMALEKIIIPRRK